MTELEPTEDAAALAIPELGDVKRRTAQEQVLESLRHAILGGVLSAGTPLVLSELSERLGVSRTPIREAIRELAAEGLVDFDSYRSAVVHTPTVEEAEELYELRLILEPLAVSKSVGKISDEQVEEASELQREMVKVEDVGRWVELNREFHAKLIDAAESPRLNGIVAGLRNVSGMQVSLSLKASPDQLERSNREHEQIVQAFRDRDADRAVELTKAHLRTTLEIIERYDAGEPAEG
ncbi:MAG: GntR family transcriptional regulator [Solirubrobacterales bacterium]